MFARYLFDNYISKYILKISYVKNNTTFNLKTANFNIQNHEFTK